MSLSVLFDVTRLAWRSRRGSPTGIDRVLIAYARWLLSHPDIRTIPVALAGSRLVRVSPARLANQLPRVNDRARKFDSQWEDLWRALHAAPGDLPPVRRPVKADAAGDWLPLGYDLARRRATGLVTPEPAGDIYLNVSHTGLDRPRLLPRLAGRGVKPIVMIHDLIPITHPEFCAPAAESRHTRRINQTVDHAALVLANSRSTADDLTRHAESTGHRPPPVLVGPLGIEAAFRPTRDAPTAVPYFVCVGTIEARKNLAFLLTVWRRLAEEMGSAAPRLVLIGRRGWENEAVVDQLERSNAARGLVHELADLTDAQLARLIAGARALLAPSLAEGYDLPALEALAIGAPVIASDIPVHGELAKGAQLVDPLDGPAWAVAIRRACAAASLPKPAPPPTWDAHFAIVEEGLRKSKESAAR